MMPKCKLQPVACGLSCLDGGGGGGRIRGGGEPLCGMQFCPYDAWFFIGHRRYVKDGHWIRDAGFLIGKR